MTDLELYDEQFVLSCLLDDPRGNEWELSGLSPSAFRDPTCRQVASALVRVRDSGRRVHWRRVRGDLRARRELAAHHLCGLLVRRAGLSWGLTAAVSRIIHRATRASR